MLTKENGIKLAAAGVGLYATYSMLAAIGAVAVSGVGFVFSAGVALAAYTAFNHVADLITKFNTKNTSEFAHHYGVLAQQDAGVLYTEACKHGGQLVNDATTFVMDQHQKVLSFYSQDTTAATVRNTFKRMLGL